MVKINSWIFLCLLMQSPLLFAETKPSESVKIPANEVDRYLPELSNYADYFARRAQETNDARLNFHHLAEGWHISVNQRMLVILQKNAERYGVPPEWFGGKDWTEVQGSFRNAFYSKRPGGIPEQQSPADFYNPYNLEAVSDRGGGFYGYHEWAARQSFSAIQQQGYAWLNELQQLNQGMKEFKKHEAEYLGFLAQAASEGKGIRDLMDQADKAPCFFKGWNWELRHPLPPDFIQLPSDVECRPVESKDCVPGCMDLARQWSHHQAQLDVILDQLLSLEYTQFFVPVGSNMKGRLPARTQGDQP